MSVAGWNFFQKRKLAKFQVSAERECALLPILARASMWITLLVDLRTASIGKTPAAAKLC
jgi:hypothetical protein